MESDSANIAARYSEMHDAELMELARSYDSLTQTAQAAIREEFARRGLEPPLLEPETVVAQRDLVTVRRYRDLSEAIVARSLLESAGIDAFLRDENFVRLEWQNSNLVGGIRLQVDAANERNALELLTQPVQESIPYREGQEFAQPHCPACGSADITFEGAARGAALASLFLASLPLPPGHPTWRCEACSARWEEPKD
jgi:hypothetical protein